MLGTEVHGGREAQVDVLGEAPVGQHADAEAWVPGVLVAEDGLGGGAVFAHDGLGADVLELDVLSVEADADAEVHGAQVNVGLVLRLALLGCRGDGEGEDI